jgi:hypothetical protein
MAIFNLVSLLRLVAGLVMGLGCLYVIVERTHQGRAPAAANLLC